MTLRASLRPPDDFDGLPRSSELEERISRVAVIVATAWITLVASWEMLGPVLAGHWAAAASMGIIADNMLRWHILGPVWDYTQTAPGPEMYYCHHPWGIFWVTTLFMKVFGRHDFVCRLPAILLSAATPTLLYAIGRSIWRPASGAAAAIAFVVLPITLAFANFNVLEVPLMTWTLLAIWGYVRLVQTNQRKYLTASAIGLMMALHTDWPAFVLSGLLLGFWLARAYLGGRRFFGPIHERRYAEVWIMWATLSVLSGVFYLAVFHKAGKLAELVAMYSVRSSGNNAPLAAVLASRRYWIELSFTPIAIVLGKVAAIVSVARLFAARSELEFIPIAYLGMAVFQYVVFKQGADIHVFWPQTFGAYFALAMGALVATLAPLVEFVRDKVRQGRGLASETSWQHAGIAALAFVAPPMMAILRDGAPAVVYARQTGGRFNEKGLPIASDGDKIHLLRDLATRLPPDSIVDLHDSMHSHWSQIWALGGRVVKPGQRLPVPSQGGKDKPYLLNSRFAPEDHLTQIASRFHVTAFDQFWVVDPREPHAAIDGFSFIEREPTLFEWLFVSATEPVRTIAPDPWLTWELRKHWNQEGPVPDAPPVTLQQQRIAYNAAVDRGDDARVAELWKQITDQLRPIGASFEGGIEIVGVQMNDGAHPRLDVYFRVQDKLAAASSLVVRSKVVAPARWSTTMADPAVREVGQPMSIPPSHMRKGFLYTSPVSIVKRPGKEVYFVTWNSRARTPAKVVGSPATTIDLLTLE